MCGGGGANRALTQILWEGADVRAERGRENIGGGFYVSPPASVFFPLPPLEASRSLDADVLFLRRRVRT